MSKGSLQLSDEEKERRKSLRLPLTKPLRYMEHVVGGYRPILVINYEIIRTYPISGMHTLLITLVTGEQLNILSAFFSHMQKPSFIKDMKKATVSVDLLDEKYGL